MEETACIFLAHMQYIYRQKAQVPGTVYTDISFFVYIFTVTEGPVSSVDVVSPHSTQ